MHINDLSKGKFHTQIHIAFHEVKANRIHFETFQILKLRRSHMIEGLNGRVINLLSFDMNRFNNIMTFLRYLWRGPVEIIVFGYYIYGEIGYYGFIGVGFILCFVPIQGMYASTHNQYYQDQPTTTKNNSTVNGHKFLFYSCNG